MGRRPNRGYRGPIALVLSAACSFDTGGVSASVGMSIGEAGSAPTDGTASDGETGSGSVATMSDSSADATDGPATCPGGGMCGTPAPAGWDGPYALNTASPPNPAQLCPPGWVEQGTAYRELLAAPATCACQCVPAAATCSVSVAYYSDAACQVATEGGSSSGDCDGMSTQQAHGFVRATPVTNGVNCTPSEQYMVPPVAWTEASVMCVPTQMVGCDGGLCLPPIPIGFESHWCVVADGDQACPDGPYGVARLRYRRADDTRTCTPCGCAVQGNVTCAGAMREYADLLCLVELDGVTVDDQCRASVVAGIDNWGIRYDGGGANYACANNGPTPVGAALSADPVTICCTG